MRPLEMKSMRRAIVGKACASWMSRAMRAGSALAAGPLAANAAPPASRPSISRRLRCGAGTALVPHHDQPIGAGFRAPQFARPAENLAHRGVALVAREAVEFFRR